LADPATSRPDVGALAIRHRPTGYGKKVKSEMSTVTGAPCLQARVRPYDSRRLTDRRTWRWCFTESPSDTVSTCRRSTCLAIPRSSWPRPPNRLRLSPMARSVAQQGGRHSHLAGSQAAVTRTRRTIHTASIQEPRLHDEGWLRPAH
jgi:hypothetical protein